MGLTYADITLLNSIDDGMAKRGVLPSEKVRKVDVRALVDTGAYMMTITEDLRDELGLDFDRHATVELADGQQTQCDLVGPIKIDFKTRSTTCLALVLPGATEVLLGAIRRTMSLMSTSHLASRSCTRLPSPKWQRVLPVGGS